MIRRISLPRASSAAAILAAASATMTTVALAPTGARAAAPVGPCAARPPAPGASIALSADTTQLGAITLRFYGARGAAVSFFECAGTRARALGERTSPAGSAETVFERATAWSCDRLTRRFAAFAVLPDGSRGYGAYSVRTTSCAHRFELVTASRLARPRRVRVRILDDWGIGAIGVRLCVTSPRKQRTCRRVAFAPSAKLATRHFDATARGRWRVELLVAGHRLRRSIAVGVRAGATAKPKAVLATGDSTMQGIDSFLADDLGDGAKVSSDVRPGFSISSANVWTPVARAQVARLHPAATVVSIGANEGFPMTVDGVKQACCDRPWVTEYSRRLRATMRVYRRSGRVLWLTLPAPRHRFRVPIFRAVNVAIMWAAKAVGGVRVMRMDRLFTPNGYRSVMRYRGRDVRVREPDGIHLNAAGTRIAAEVIARALRGG